MNFFSELCLPRIDSNEISNNNSNVSWFHLSIESVTPLTAWSARFPANSSADAARAAAACLILCALLQLGDAAVALPLEDDPTRRRLSDRMSLWFL